MGNRIHDLDAERALLACLMSRDVDVAVQQHDFDDERHRAIFAAITAIRARGESPDVVTVRHEVGAAVDPLYLLDVQGAEISTSKVQQHAGIVIQTARRRRLYEQGTLIAAAAQRGDEIDPHAMIDAAIGTDTGMDTNIDALVSGKLATIGKGRPFVELDQFPGMHLHFGDFAIIAGRPGVGKSAFALQVVSELAAGGLKTRVYSLEMRAADWVDRLIQQRTNVTTYDLDAGVTGDTAKLVESALSEVRNWPLEIIDRNIGVAAVCADIRRFARRGGRLVVIDYLGLLVGATRGGTRYEAVTEASRQLKITAMETGVVLVALSQLNRGLVSRSGLTRPPVLSDLRESGALEQDADDVILLHHYPDKAAYAAQDTSTGDTLNDPRPGLERMGYILEHEGVYPLASVHFAKMRRGAPRRFAAYFIGKDMYFAPLDQKEKR